LTRRNGGLTGKNAGLTGKNGGFKLTRKKMWID
jgi:hypothetical protein